MQSITTQPLKALPKQLSVPADKSITHRALVFNALASGQAEITNLLRAADTDATIAILEQLGVVMRWQTAQSIMIQGREAQFQWPTKFLNCCNSGTTARLLCGLLAASPMAVILTGDASLSRRPMTRVIEPLKQMGVRFSHTSHLPLVIHGDPEIRGIRYDMPIPSAQVKTALLLAGLQATGTTVIQQPAISRDHSERMLSAMGAVIDVHDLSLFILGKQSLKTVSLTIPGDFSSAAYWIVAACLIPQSSLRLRDVGVNVTRTALIDVLQSMGASITLVHGRQSQQEPLADIDVQSTSLKGVEVPSKLIPNLQDEIPILCIAAAFAEGTTIIRGASELRVKESDRLQAMYTGLTACGIRCDHLSDGIIIHGGVFKPATIDSYGDHRIAMAFLIAGSCSGQAITVKDTACIATSYPDFLDILVSFYS